MKSIFAANPIIIVRIAKLIKTVEKRQRFNELTVRWGDAEFTIDDMNGVDDVDTWIHEFTEYAINDVFKSYGFSREFREEGYYLYYDDRLLHAEARHALASLCTISTVISKDGLIPVDPDGFWTMLRNGVEEYKIRDGNQITWHIDSAAPFINVLTLSYEKSEYFVMSRHFLLLEKNGQLSVFRTMTGQIFTLLLKFGRGTIWCEYSYAVGNDRLHHYRWFTDMMKARQWIKRSITRLMKRFSNDCRVELPNKMLKTIRAFIDNKVKVLIESDN